MTTKHKRHLLFSLLLATACGNETERPKWSDNCSTEGDDTGQSEDTGQPEDTEETDSLLLTEAFETSLTQVMACSGTFFYAYNEAGTIGLAFFRSMEPTTDPSTPLVVGIDDFNLRVDLGADVPTNYCTDVLETDAIELSYNALSADQAPETTPLPTVTFAFNFPECEDCMPQIQIRVQDVWLASPSGHQIKIDDWTSSYADIIENWGG